ncbi:MAG: hypothetical protein AB7S26_26035 [Sandaracinaceae bacterium]
MTSRMAGWLGASAIALLTGALAAACESSPPDPEPRTCPTSPPRVDLAGALACDAPSAIDLDAVVDLTSFRATASKAVCDWSLHCTADLGWALAQSFCHPGFAAQDGEAAASVPFDDVAARACLVALRDASSCQAALEIAFYCLEVSRGTTRVPCSDDTFCNDGERCEAGVCTVVTEGAPCPRNGCGLGLVCWRGSCQRSTECACEADVDCGNSEQCFFGICRRGVEGESCIGTSCADGLICQTGRCVLAAQPGEACQVTQDCALGACVEGVCLATHHLGCGCTSDLECPLDVSRCVDGTCVARPMLGDSCDPAGAPCFGSGCYDGTCDPIRDGDACSRSSECATGLSCSATYFRPGLCGAPRAEGARCGPTLAGACASGLACTVNGCAAPAMVGESCADRPCVAGADCESDVCVGPSP